MPENWPVLVLALSSALIAAYVVANAVARVVRSMLRSVIGDEQVETLLVDRPRRIVQLVIFLIVAAALAFPALTIAGYSTGIGGSPDALLRWSLGAGLRIGVIVIAGYLVVRIGSAAARRFEHDMSAGTGLDVVERTKRARTLGRLLQKTLSILVTGIAGLMILRELAIDITPVLTGAGIVGLAVGFGAQTLVRDVISGFFLIVEDQVRVGDVATVNGQGGLVEQVNLRTIVLRDELGAVHVFPNGEVKTLANQSKDFSYYIITISVPFEDDPDKVMAAMRQASDDLMADSTFRPHILEPLDIFGIDAFEPGQVVVKARIKTVPLKQWMVGRELRRRIASIFRERGYHLPRATVSMRLERDQIRTDGGVDR